MIPSKRELARCAGCGKPVLWTVTAAGQRMPVDPRPDERGNQACYRDGPRAWRSRSLDGTGALPPAAWEHRYMPHAATCKPRPKPTPAVLPPNVVRLDPTRRRRP